MEETLAEAASNDRILRDCTAILHKEIELLGKIPPLQALIRDAVIGKEWTDYELFIESVNKISAEFDALEAERMELFRNLAGGGEDDEKKRFYAIAARLPAADREKLTALYRKLKMETLQIRLSNDTLLDYIKESKAAITGVLETAYPDRKGKLYSRTGAAREADMKSVVINHSF
jgi:hypothetical protein